MNITVGTSDGLLRVGDGQVAELSGRDVAHVIVNDGAWWAIIDGREVWRSADGARWEPVASVEGLTVNCLLATRDGLLAGTSGAHLYRLDGDSLQPIGSFEAAPGRESWFTPWGGPPDVRSIAGSPASAVYVNVHVGGVVASPNGRDDWSPTLEIESDVHQVVYDHDSGRILAAAARGLGSSEDGGENWTFETAGLHAPYCRAVAVSGDIVLVTASTGPRTNRAAAYRKQLGAGGYLEKCTDGLPDWFPTNIDTHCLATSGETAAFGTSEGTVYASSDQGLTWEKVADRLPAVRCVAFP